MEISKKTVLFFDICSSSAIIEDLHKNDNEDKWKQVILNISRFLNNYDEKGLFKIYKFLGDGWILIFDEKLDPEKFFFFLEELCDHYASNYKRYISKILDNPISPVGIAFGMDRGKLIELQLNGKNEFLGRSLNIASRLQSAIKDKDEKPQYKLLMTNHLYADLSMFIRKRYKVQRVRRTLRNISDKELEFKKIFIYPPLNR